MGVCSPYIVVQGTALQMRVQIRSAAVRQSFPTPKCVSSRKNQYRVTKGTMSLFEDPDITGADPIMYFQMIPNIFSWVSLFGTETKKITSSGLITIHW